jgi:hypothetical protein
MINLGVLYGTKKCLSPNFTTSTGSFDGIAKPKG